MVLIFVCGALVGEAVFRGRLHNGVPPPINPDHH
jgi:hypothetical protein